MSKAQLTIKNKAGAGQHDTKKFLPTPNHSLQLWNLLLVNVGISHLQMVPGSQVMKLVSYGFQTGMAAALTKRNSNVLCQSLWWFLNHSTCLEERNSPVKRVLWWAWQSTASSYWGNFNVNLFGTQQCPGNWGICGLFLWDARGSS